MNKVPTKPLTGKDEGITKKQNEGKQTAQNDKVVSNTGKKSMLEDDGNLIAVKRGSKEGNGSEKLGYMQTAKSTK